MVNKMKALWGKWGIENRHQDDCRDNRNIILTCQKKCVKPPPLCRFVRPLSQTWTFGDPCDSFRLFCTSRTCSPKSVKAPEYYMLGQRSSSNNEHGRGITHMLSTSSWYDKSSISSNDSMQQEYYTYIFSINVVSESGTIHSSSRWINSADLSLSFDNWCW